jgi:hypothetical protein
LRLIWIAKRQPFMANHLERLAFIDETSVKSNMAKTTGWAPRGQRLVDHAPFGHWRTKTFVAALRHDRMDAPWVIDGAMNAEMFDRYVTTQLVPTLRQGDVVILDNLSSHKSSCRPTAPISTQAKWHSQSSRRCSARPPPEPTISYGTLSDRSAICSLKKNATTSSKPQGTNPIKGDTL